jgi:hypothetical protein
MALASSTTTTMTIQGRSKSLPDECERIDLHTVGKAIDRHLSESSDRLTAPSLEFINDARVLGVRLHPKKRKGKWVIAKAGNTQISKDPKPKFKPLPYKVGHYWRVEVEWPDGVTQHVDDFGSESEALEWIARKSDDWARKHPKSG